MKPKNKAAQALRALAKPKNMARPSHLARKAALAMWEKRRAAALV